MIQELTRQHAEQGGRTTVASAVNRDLRIELADNRLVDFSGVCPRFWYTKRETFIDFAVGGLGFNRPFWGGLQRPAIRAMADAQPDVVLIHEGQYALASIPFWRRLLPSIPRVLYVHNPVSRSYARPELRRLLRGLNGMVFVSTDARNRFADRVKGRLPETAVVHNGVADALFHSRGRTVDSAGRLRVTFAGQVSDYKGPHLMLRAIARAGIGPDCVIRVIGSSAHRENISLSDYEQRLRELATELELRVEFIPYCRQEMLSGYLRESDVVCVPSVWHEPFGMAALEAMACGAAVICSDRGGLPEACGDGALLIDPEDGGQFAAAISEMSDSRRRSVWQRRAAARADRMTWAKSYAALGEALPRLVGGR